jgi:hypothetical protein
MLFKLRAWLKSDTLKTGGLLGILGAVQAWFQTSEGMGILDMAAQIIGISSGTFSGVVVGLCGLAMLIHRAFTEWGLDEKAAGKDKGFITLAFLGVLFLVSLYSMSAMADTITFRWENPTEYENDAPLTLSEFQRFDLGCGPNPGDRNSIVRSWVATAATMRAEQFPVPGQYFCALNLTALGAATENMPRSSAWSNEVSFTVAPTIPKPPQNLTAENG